MTSGCSIAESMLPLAEAHSEVDSIDSVPTDSTSHFVWGLHNPQTCIYMAILMPDPCPQYRDSACYQDHVLGSFACSVLGQHWTCAPLGLVSRAPVMLLTDGPPIPGQPMRNPDPASHHHRIGVPCHPPMWLSSAAWSGVRCPGRAEIHC